MILFPTQESEERTEGNLVQAVWQPAHPRIPLFRPYRHPGALASAHPPREHRPPLSRHPLSEHRQESLTRVAHASAIRVHLAFSRSARSSSSLLLLFGITL